MTKTLPRGIRNNNPLNIRIGNRWIGEVENPTDKEFEQFKDMKFGLRAGFILLKRYIERYQLTTITDIISRWAPSKENNTKEYIAMVSNFSGIGILDEISFNNSFQMIDLVQGMIIVECGQTLNNVEVADAYWRVRKNILPDV